MADTNWWSLRPLARPELPKLAAEDTARVERAGRAARDDGFALLGALPFAAIGAGDELHVQRAVRRAVRQAAHAKTADGNAAGRECDALLSSC